MDDDGVQRLLGDLRELEIYASQFATVVGAAQEAAPSGGVGRDRTGVAKAEVDSEGWLTSVELARDWARELSPEQLGPALMEAVQAARDDHLNAWGEQLQAKDWKYDAADLDRGRLPKPAESPFVVPTSSGPPPSASRFIEDVLSELDRSHAMAASPAQPSETTVASPSGTVSIVVQDRSFKSLDIDSAWAQRSSASTIAGEVSAALARARLRPPEASSEREQAGARHDQLLSDAIKLLNQLRYERPSR